MLNHKIPPPVVAFIVAACAWWVTDVHYVLNPLQWQFWATVVSVGLALLFDLPALYQFHSVKTTINPLQPGRAKCLVTTGIFNFSRNPMYVGLVFWLLAFGFFISSLWIFLSVICFIAYITVFQILPEEQALTIKFGKEFEEYKKCVRMWL